MKKYLFSNSTTEVNASIGLLILRAGSGLMMAVHGWDKFQDFTNKVKTFSAPKFFLVSWMSNHVALSAAIFAELVCAILIVIGLATRPAAFFFAFTMLMARFFVPIPEAFAATAHEMSALYLLIGIVILITGAGKFSIDGRSHNTKKRLFS